MSFNPESYSNEEIIDTPVSEQEVFEQSPLDEEFSLEDYFDDGFGDRENEPNHVILNNETDIKEIEKTYGVDVASLIEEKFAA